MPTVSMSRRAFFRGACSCCAAAMTGVAEASPLRQGCFLTAAGRKRIDTLQLHLVSVNDSLIVTTGNGAWTTGRAEIDRELDGAIRTCAGILQVQPAFAFYDEDKLRGEDTLLNWNAFADPRDVNVPGTHGFVGFGHQLFRDELYGYDETGTSIMSVVAHEFGHIIQFTHGYFEPMRQQVAMLGIENNADFLSGYYLGVRKRRVRWLNLQTALNLFERLGRLENGNPDRTHGNSEERVGAASAGYAVGVDESKALEDAIQAGWRYVGYNG